MYYYDIVGPGHSRGPGGGAGPGELRGRSLGCAYRRWLTSQRLGQTNYESVFLYIGLHRSVN